MTEGFFIENSRPDVIVRFAEGGVLQSGVIWIYERDGGVAFARDPELAVRGVEGDGRAGEVWKGV